MTLSIQGITIHLSDELVHKHEAVFQQDFTIKEAFDQIYLSYCAIEEEVPDFREFHLLVQNMSPSKIQYYIEFGLKAELMYHRPIS